MENVLGHDCWKITLSCGAACVMAWYFTADPEDGTVRLLLEAGTPCYLREVDVDSDGEREVVAWGGALVIYTIGVAITTSQTRAEALELAIKALKLFPINVYNDLYADIVGHETYAGTVQCAAQNDLIPAAWIADGRLYPQRTVTAADFLAVLMPGAAGRRPLAAPSPLPDSVPAYARFAAGQAVAEQLISADSLNDPITRSDAAALCRRLHI